MVGNVIIKLLMFDQPISGLIIIIVIFAAFHFISSYAKLKNAIFLFTDKFASLEIA